MRLAFVFAVTAGSLCGCGAGGSSDPSAQSQSDAQAADATAPLDAPDGDAFGVADGSESTVEGQACPFPDGAGVSSLLHGSIPLDSDAQACSGRPTLACPVGQGATNQIAALIESCHGDVAESAVLIEFRDGCASAVFGGAAGGLDTACVERALDAQRWLCAVGLDCAAFGASTLP